MTTVRVYDFDTKVITTIPAAELASGMIRARIEGIEGEVFVEASKLKGAPLRHPPFEGERKELMQKFATIFAGVYDQTAEGWEDGFRRDSNPDKEIAFWRMMADVLLWVDERHRLPPDQRSEAFQVILASMNNGTRLALKTVALRTLARPLAKEIVAEIERRISAK